MSTDAGSPQATPPAPAEAPAVVAEPPADAGAPQTRKPDKPEKARPDLAAHVRAVARDVGAAEPPAEHMEQIAAIPLIREFESLLSAPAEAYAERGLESPETKGNDLLHTTLVTVLGLCNAAAANCQEKGIPLSPLVQATRRALRPVVQGHGRKAGRA